MKNKHFISKSKIVNLKSILVLTSLLLFSLFTFHFSLAQPTPLTKANYPKNGDSITIKDCSINPSQSFYPDTTNYLKKDSLTIDRSITKSLHQLGDIVMENFPAMTGNQTWNLTTYLYTANATNTDINYKTPDAKVLGASSFPTANLWYSANNQGSQSNIFQLVDDTGYYNIGSYVYATANSSAGELTYNVKSPIVEFPVDYNNPANVPFMNLVSTFEGTQTNTTLNVTVDAYGTLNLTTGSGANQITTPYANCIRTVTYTHDSANYNSLYSEWNNKRIYNWYSPKYPYPIISYSYEQVRNNLNPSKWTSYTPPKYWYDKFELTYITNYKGLRAGINDLTKKENFAIIYPNPSNGVFTVVQNKTDNKPVLLEVSDILGNIVYSKKISGLVNNLDLTGKAKGVYLVKIYLSTEPIIQKVIIK